MKTAATIAAPAISHAATSVGLIQRQCACAGKSTGSPCGAEQCTRKKFAGVQAKSRLSVPGDALELEADRVAEQVMALSPARGDGAASAALRPLVQRAGAKATDPELPASVSRVLDTPGQALDPAARSFFEPRFGHDFSRVRVHADALSAEAARAISAHAFTSGLHVVLDAGRYEPATPRGRQLLAHELTHVVQQTGTLVPSGAGASGSTPAGAPGGQAPLTITGAGASASSVISRRGAPAPPALARRPPTQQRRAPIPAKLRRMMEPDARERRHGPGTQADAESALPWGVPQHAPEPGTMDWDLEQNLKGLDKHRAEAELDITTIRGGNPPDFITTGAERLLATPRGNVRYSPRSFHVLDALKFDATNAKTLDDEINVFVDYMPDVIRTLEGFEDVVPVRSPKGKATTLGTTQALHSLYIEPWTPETEDPQGKLRLKIYFEVLASKSPKVTPDPKQKPQPKPQTDGETAPKPATSGPMPKHVPAGGRCPTGTKADPIGMIWCKPKKFYKTSLKLYGGEYARDTQKALTIGTKEKIGVPDWPGRGTLLKREKTPRGKTADQFKNAIAEEGFEQWEHYSPDHVLDLFFKGKDRFDNLWPLEREVNARAGTWHPGQPVCYSDPPHFKPTWKALGTLELVGRWFVVKEVREPPP